MKNLVISIFLSLGTAHASSFITINAGSKAVINAGEEVTVLCSSKTSDISTANGLTKVAICGRRCNNQSYSEGSVLHIDLLSADGKVVNTSCSHVGVEKCLDLLGKINGGL